MRKNYVTLLNGGLRCAALLLIMTGTSMLTSARTGEYIKNAWDSDGNYYTVDLAYENAWFERINSANRNPEELTIAWRVDCDGWGNGSYLVTEIELNALAGCTNLKKLSMSSTFVSRTGNFTTRLLADCTSLEHIEVGGNEWDLSDGTVINPDLKELKAFLPSRVASENPIVWDVNNYGTYINPYIFYKCQATTLVMSNDHEIVKIDESAFVGWSNFKEIYLPFDVIFDSAWWELFLESLRKASISPKQITIYIDTYGMSQEDFDNLVNDPNMPVSQYIHQFKEYKSGAYSSISTPTVDTDETAPIEYFNLSGMKVNADQLTPGLYIKRQGSKAKKVLIK